MEGTSLHRGRERMMDTPGDLVLFVREGIRHI